MRINAKAKKADTSEWIYGCVIYDVRGTNQTVMCSREDGEIYTVDEDTVCEYSGLQTTGDEPKDIFLHDILRITMAPNGSEDDYRDFEYDYPVVSIIDGLPFAVSVEIPDDGEKKKFSFPLAWLPRQLEEMGWTVISIEHMGNSLEMSYNDVNKEKIIADSIG